MYVKHWVGVFDMNVIIVNFKIYFDKNSFYICLTSRVMVIQSQTVCGLVEDFVGWIGNEIDNVSLTQSGTSFERRVNQKI